MARVTLVHWKPEEAAARLEALREAGFEAALAPSRPATPEWKKLCALPPDAFVIDLDRLPSHGREVANVLRHQKSTRAVPIVFAGGLPEKVATAREVLPDAHFAEWKRIGPALRKAIRSGVVAPVIPEHLGHPAASLTKRLGIGEGAVVTMLGSPARFERTLEPLPAGVVLQEGARGDSPGVLLLFVESSLDLARRFDGAAGMLAGGGKFWVLWPKKASGVRTDLSMPFIRAFASDAGWIDYKVCSVDATWSGMLFGRRR